MQPERLNPAKYFLILMIGMVSTLAAAPTGDGVDFNRDVRPILSNRCFKCHGPDKESRKGGLRLDERQAAIGEGKSGEIAIVPGKIAESEVVKRLHAEDPDERMPPASAKMELTENEKKVIEAWIAGGAPFDAHWSFAAPATDGGKHTIDEFIGKRLAAEGLKPSAQAGKYQLIRRVSLDLTGLPPTPGEADTFARDTSPDAYEQAVDRLLASPRYGERWARRWLDLARYADTNGYEKDRERPIWPWRDWVIRSLNADMPFDQFTVRQLAGDMLPGATVDDITATGFHRNSMLNEEGGIDPLEFRYHAMADRVATTGTTWLGLTVGCAQCHTHKYDPILHTDYFGMMAFLNNADEINLDLPDASLADRQEARYRQAEKMIAELPGKWPVAKEPDARWVTPALVSVTAGSGEVARLLPDQSALFADPGPDKETQELLFEAQAGTVDRVRLEALADPGIVSGGPGRTGHGNFVLSEIEVYVRAKVAGAEWEKAGFSAASAEAEQSGYPVASAIDGKPETGWAVQVEGGSHKQDRAAVFRLGTPLGAGLREFKVRLVQNYGSRHTIGRMRISLGSPVERSTPVVSEEERRKVALDLAFGRWMDELREKTAPWTVLNPAGMNSNEPILTAEPHGTIFVSGDTTKDDRFTLTFERPPAGITSIRLETPTDSRLPGFGPGKVYYEGTPGDFFLYSFTLKADGKEIRLASASSTVGDAALAIDGNDLTGWTPKERVGSPHAAIFKLEEPLPTAESLVIELKMGRYYASTLGKFRLSVSSSPGIPKARVLPAGMEEALAGGQIGAADQAVLFRHFLLNAPELRDQAKPVLDLLKPIVGQRTLILQEREEHARKTFLHKRGEFTQPDAEIQPHVPAFLPPMAADLPGNRLGFAKWLVSRNNPLTARVTVNRQWQAFFGTGLVKTLDDFGYQGESPSHPELLDWLAVTFMDSGWSMKRLHRLIVTSATYKQDSRLTPEMLARDPQNRLLARGPRVRAEAEMIRDITLAASGLLSDKLFGPPVRPPQPASVTEGAYGGMSWKVSEGEDRYRRALYTFAKRSAPFASFQTFDAPTGEACVARREVSNTPLQSLVLLNDEVFMEAAAGLGKKLSSEPGTVAEKAALAFQRCVSRPPTPQETEKLVAFHTRQTARFESGELKAAELVPGGATNDEAVWTTVARVLLNLDETITKN